MAVEAKIEKSNTNNIVKFYKEVKAEFKKITWATKDEVFKTTGIVIATILLFTLLVWLYDSFFGFVFKSMLEYLK